MAVSALSAARAVCELRDWDVSNLAIQKILYLAQMFSLGRRGEPLLHEGFEAWDYGPVVPEVYRRARGFGSGPVRNVFHWVPSVPEGTPEYEIIKEVARDTRRLTPGQLVNITHWPDGAWAKKYVPGKLGVKIPNELIRGEYLDRQRAAVGA